MHCLGHSFDSVGALKKNDGCPSLGTGVLVKLKYMLYLSHMSHKIEMFTSFF